MARHARVVIPGSPHHVTQRGNRRQQTFFSDANYLTYLRFAAEAVGATHLRDTRLINRRERWAGYLWQGRFASFPMDEDYLLTCARYVGLNPVRAGLTARESRGHYM